MTSRFTKLDSAEQPLTIEAPEWSAVLDNTTNLIWDAGETKLSFAAMRERSSAYPPPCGIFTPFTAAYSSTPFR